MRLEIYSVFDFFIRGRMPRTITNASHSRLSSPSPPSATRINPFSGLPITASAPSATKTFDLYNSTVFSVLLTPGGRDIQIWKLVSYVI